MLGSCSIRLPSSLISNLSPLQGFPHHDSTLILFLFIFLAVFLSRYKVVKVCEVVSSPGPSASWGHPFNFFHCLLLSLSSWSAVFSWVPWKQTQRPVTWRLMGREGALHLQGSEKTGWTEIQLQWICSRPHGALTNGSKGPGPSTALALPRGPGCSSFPRLSLPLLCGSVGFAVAVVS